MTLHAITTNLNTNLNFTNILNLGKKALCEVHCNVFLWRESKILATVMRILCNSRTRTF